MLPTETDELCVEGFVVPCLMFVRVLLFTVLSALP
jgi:hypothetical protein